MNEVFLESGNVGPATSMPTSTDDLDEMISIRISKTDLAEIQRLAKDFNLKPMTISRIALRSGLDSMDRDPGETLRRAAGQRPKPSQPRKTPRAEPKQKGGR